MRLRGLSRLRKIVRWLKYNFAHQAIIIFYHRISNLSHTLFPLSVSPEKFKEHLDVLTKYFIPIKFSDFINHINNRTLPKKAIVITFDDGYADNFWNAYPLLKHFGIPATIFVTTGLIGTNQEAYWDELERLLLLQGEVTTEVSITFDSYTRHWKMTTPEERMKAYLEIFNIITLMPQEKRELILAQLRSALKTKSDSRPEYRFMSVNELIEISRDGLVEIGAHTVNHADLPALSPELQQWEIAMSKHQLEEWLGRPVDLFAYPYGHVNDLTRRIVIEAGFKAACSTMRGAVTYKSDPFCLPRVRVDEWDGERFLRSLRRLLEG